MRCGLSIVNVSQGSFLTVPTARQSDRVLLLPCTAVMDTSPAPPHQAPIVLNRIHRQCCIPHTGCCDDVLAGLGHADVHKGIRAVEKRQPMQQLGQLGSIGRFHGNRHDGFGLKAQRCERQAPGVARQRGAFQDGGVDAANGHDVARWNALRYENETFIPINPDDLERLTQKHTSSDSRPRPIIK